MSRPDFCTASFRRSVIHGAEPPSAGVRLALTASGERVAAVAVGQKARHAADGRDAHAGEAVDLPVGQARLQPLHHGPAIGHRLQLGRRAQIAKEGAAFLQRLQRGDGGEQVALGERLLAGA